ncbi:hypothetical protein IAT38_002046 [Cryptococcus sp. DSM 104549]
METRRVASSGPYRGKISQDDKGRRLIGPRLPDPPRRGHNAFTLWCKTYYPTVKDKYSDHPDAKVSNRTFTRDASFKWKDMSAEEREPWLEEAQKLREAYEAAYEAYWDDTTEAQRDVARHITGLRLKPPKSRKVVQEATKAPPKVPPKASPKVAPKGDLFRAYNRRPGYALFIEEKVEEEGGNSGRRLTLKEASAMWQRMDDRDKYRYTLMAEERRNTEERKKAKKPRSGETEKAVAPSEEDEEEI